MINSTKELTHEDKEKLRFPVCWILICQKVYFVLHFLCRMFFCLHGGQEHRNHKLSLLERHNGPIRMFTKNALWRKSKVALIKCDLIINLFVLLPTLLLKSVVQCTCMFLTAIQANFRKKQKRKICFTVRLFQLFVNHQMTLGTQLGQLAEICYRKWFVMCEEAGVKGKKPTTVSESVELLLCLQQEFQNE